jgi:hypothetical protein
VNVFELVGWFIGAGPMAFIDSPDWVSQGGTLNTEFPRAAKPGRHIRYNSAWRQ